MNRFGSVFWLVLVVVAGFATFKAKYAIQDLEDQLTKVRKQTIAAQSEIRILNAEWQYLNQPERLAELNKKFLNLTPIVPKQLQERVDDIPLRPTPEPATPPDLIAAASGGTPEPAAGASGPTEPSRQVAAAVPVAAQPPVAAPRAAAVLAGATPSRPTPVMGGTGTPHAAPAVARGPVPHVQLAKAGPASLDSLIAQIAEVH